MECSTRDMLSGKAGDIGEGWGITGVLGILVHRKVCRVFMYPAGMR